MQTGLIPDNEKGLRRALDLDDPWRKVPQQYVDAIKRAEDMLRLEGKRQWPQLDPSAIAAVLCAVELTDRTARKDLARYQAMTQEEVERLDLIEQGEIVEPDPVPAEARSEGE